MKNLKKSNTYFLSFEKTSQYINLDNTNYSKTDHFKY